MSDWLLDVTHSTPAWVPYDETTGDVVIGLSVLSDGCPGNPYGVYHMDGKEAVEAWCDANPDWAEKWMGHQHA